MCAFVPVVDYTQSSGAPMDFLPVTLGPGLGATVELACNGGYRICIIFLIIGHCFISLQFVEHISV